MYPVNTICQIINGSFLQKAGEQTILHLVYDSRRLPQAETSLFFALVTEHNDGHRFVEDAYKKGVRNFIVSKNIPLLQDANIILVEDTLQALQALAAHHRHQFTIPVIGITGSNGKTIVKEWLFQLLHEDFNIARSPKSYNSQVGVPLSVWQMNEQHGLAIFEAGISRPGEMERLEKIIRPTIGILTNIGDAHDEGFENKKAKEKEKTKLFAAAELVIFPGDDLEGVREMAEEINREAGRKPFLQFSWGYKEYNQFHIKSIRSQAGVTQIEAMVGGKLFSVSIAFTDGASIENAITCCCLMLVLGYDENLIKQRISGLHAIDMRLQLKHSFNECLVINDSYSADLTSLKIALDFQKQQASSLKHTVILSEFVESGKKDTDLYREIAGLLSVYKIKKLVVIGEKIIDILKQNTGSGIEFISYSSTEDFIHDFKSSAFFREIILIKGARKFEFERIAKLFEEKKHQTVLEVNLNALAHNLKEYHKILKPGTKVMAMVKAFSYGSGGAEIASVLQYHNVDYLGVAYADEGVDLVKSGISLPIMVMNAEASSFQSIVDYNLQPVIYSPGLLKAFEAYIKEQGLNSYPVHLELETGMNRLGFSIN
ncbi:MAG TPA: UDP-N-acetylmuramoyl-tripeptide--D-alanyl-D-alanine ligase, partial [Flavisolibacter sp.]